MVRYLLLPLLLVISALYRADAITTKCSAPTAGLCHQPNGANFVECTGDCNCSDKMYGQCQTPTPVTSVHVDSIAECMAFCQVFAMEDRCKFFIFDYDNVDENCALMDDDMASYSDHCLMRGSPLWTPTAGTGIGDCSPDNNCDISGCNCNSQCCWDSPLNGCSKCDNCQNDPCKGFKWVDCTIDSNAELESEVRQSWGLCEMFGRLQATYVTYQLEEQTCITWGSGRRTCKKVMVTVDTSLTNCIA